MHNLDNLVRKGMYGIAKSLDYLIEWGFLLEQAHYIFYALTAAEGPGHVKYAGQVPKPFSASVLTSTVKNTASFTSSQLHLCMSLRFLLMFISGWTYKQECDMP